MRWLRRYNCQIACAFEFATLVEITVPAHVKRVSVFKDFNYHLVTALQTTTPYLGPESETTPAVNLALAKAFATKSRSNWEHLSISYMIDAQQVFTACQQQPCDNWSILQSLTLTASTLAQTAPRPNIYKLLRNATLTARNMLQLKRMVLWNSEPGHACAFFYQRDVATHTATLIWRGTWDLDLELQHEVVEAWKKVAAASDFCSLRVEKEALRNVEIRSHGDAIYHLSLPEGVVDPGSLDQIRREGRMQRLA